MSERIIELRPFPMGVSIGHSAITAGTASCVVADKATGELFVLSNNHVFANCNDAEIGDPILQQGAYDGGKNRVGSLAKFIPIAPANSGPSTCPIAKGLLFLINGIYSIFQRKTRFYTKVEEPAPENVVDCALMKPDTPDIFLNEIMGLDKAFPRGSARGVEGANVVKSGRTTGVTTGIIIDDDATIMVGYPNGTVTFNHQIVVNNPNASFIQGGDSGSALLNADGYVVGLCFAGTDDGKTGIANHIMAVEDLLNVQVCIKNQH